METTTEATDNLLAKILPPRLEDAGLEDCALPPDSIKEAFLKAATAVKSRAASIFSATESDGDCVSDPWPTAKETSDVLVGIDPGEGPAGACAVEKGGGTPGVIDGEVAVGVTGAEEMADKVVGPDVQDGGGMKACVDGLQGLSIGEKGIEYKDNESKKEEDKDEDDDDGEKPILAEAYI